MELRKNKNGDLHESVVSVSTNNFYYNLFDSGCIKPGKILTPEYAKKVDDAVATIKKFERFLGVMDLLK